MGTDRDEVISPIESKCEIQSIQGTISDLQKEKNSSDLNPLEDFEP